MSGGSWRVYLLVEVEERSYWKNIMVVVTTTIPMQLFVVVTG